ncbi:MAG: hypothetical protein AAF492_28980, partial [Verrucomicrobiota bacterium]
MGPFVDYPKPTISYLKRIQAGDQAHAFDTRTSPDVATWQRDARQALGNLIGLKRIKRDLDRFEPTITLDE